MLPPDGGQAAPAGAEDAQHVGVGEQHRQPGMADGAGDHPVGAGTDLLRPSRRRRPDASTRTSRGCPCGCRSCADPRTRRSPTRGGRRRPRPGRRARPAWRCPRARLQRAGEHRAASMPGVGEHRRQRHRPAPALLVEGDVGPPGVASAAGSTSSRRGGRAPRGRRQPRRSCAGASRGPDPGSGEVQLEPPRLADEVVTEAVVRLLVDQPEPGRLVDPPAATSTSLVHSTIDPYPARRGERHALVDQPPAEAQATGPRLDEQDPQLRRVVVAVAAQHAPGPHAVDLGDPPGLPPVRAAGPEVGDDARDQAPRRSRPSRTRRRRPRRGAGPSTRGHRGPRSRTITVGSSDRRRPACPAVPSASTSARRCSGGSDVSRPDTWAADRSSSSAAAARPGRGERHRRRRRPSTASAPLTTSPAGSQPGQHPGRGSWRPSRAGRGARRAPTRSAAGQLVQHPRLGQRVVGVEQAAIEQSRASPSTAG